MMMRFVTAAALTLMSLPAGARIAVSPSVVNFGSVEVNSGLGRQQSVSVRNDSEENARISVSPVGCGFDFRVQDFGCLSLRPRGSCQIQVSFRPSRAGYQSCNVSIYGGLAGTGHLSLSGNGVER